jgi:hypothetical protein
VLGGACGRSRCLILLDGEEACYAMMAAKLWSAED